MKILTRLTGTRHRQACPTSCFAHLCLAKIGPGSATTAAKSRRPAATKVRPAATTTSQKLTSEA